MARGLQAISPTRSFSSTTMLRKAEYTSRGAAQHRAGPSCPLCSPKRPQLGWSLWPSTGSVASTSQDEDAPLQRSQKQLGYREWERHMSLTRMSWYNPHRDEGARAAAAAEFPTEEAPRQSEKGGPDDDSAQYEQLKQQILRNVGFEFDEEEEESAKQGGKDSSRAQAALNPNPRPKTQHDYMILQASGSADTNRRDDRDNQGPGKQQMKEESKYSIKKEDEYSDAHAMAWFQLMKEKGKYSNHDNEKYSGAQAGVQNTQASTPDMQHFTLEHLKELETVFKQTRYPCLVLRNYLAGLMNVTEGRIKIWFRHRRSKLRRLRIMPYSRIQKNRVTSNFGKNFGDSQQPDQTQMRPNQDPGPTQVPMAPMPSQSPRPNQALVAPVPSPGPQSDQVPLVLMPNQEPRPNQEPVVPMPNQVPVVPVLSPVPMVILMPSQVPVVVPYSILPLMMPLVPVLSPAYPPGLPTPYPVLPVAVPTVFPGFVPVMQPVLPNIPVYPQPIPPRCLPPIGPTCFVTVSGPFPPLY